jgi:exoribonuclease-2
MNVGSVIAFRDKRSVVLALVRRDDGKVLRVVNEKGKEFRYPRNRVALDLGGAREAGLSPEEVRSELKGIKKQAVDLQGEIDLELLWESVREDRPEGGTLKELGDLYFGENPTPLQLLSLLSVLEADSAYFKRKAEILVPKEEVAVRETLRQQAEAEERERARIAAVTWLRTRVEGREIPESELPPEAARERLMDLLKSVACLGEEAPGWPEVGNLLEELGYTTANGAFDVLLRLGIFQPDENLSVHEYDVQVEFPENVLTEATRLAEEEIPESRLDLRELETITIDDAETTEVDDALSLEDLGEGKLRVWVHIADVAAFVPKDSLVDRHALKRATTVYAPDRTIPMIPEVLSMGHCSLQVGEDRPALSVKLDLDVEGALVESSFHASRIRVDRSHTYEEIEEMVHEEGLVHSLFEVSELQRKRREEAGAQSFERQELRIKVDADREIFVKKVVGDSSGQVLVSELMVLANRVAGQALFEAELPALYKRQTRPKGEGGGFLPKSTVGLEPGEHFGLGVPYYCQMTSPIRRYGDLAMHRQLGTLIGRPFPGHSEEELGAILATCQEREMAAGAVQKEGNRYWLLRYLQRQDHKDHPAVVGTHKRGSLIGVKLEDVLLPCMLPAPQGKSFKAGERIMVRLTDVHPRRKRVRLRYLEHLPMDVDAVLAGDDRPSGTDR